MLCYGAAVLEGGLGFLQFFWDRDRMCALDRLAETIVVDVRRGSQPHSKQTYSKQVKARNQLEAARCIRYPHQRLVTPVTLSRTCLHSKI